MNKEQENLLKILSDALWQRTPEYAYSQQEWEDILYAAEEQGVLFLLLQGCSSIRQQFSDAGWLKWRSKLISTMIHNESLMEAQDKIVDALEKDHIPYTVLKGTSLSACYYNPSVRALGDLDLLVPVSFIDRASGILTAQGFHAPEASFAHPYHIDFYKDNVVTELHYAVSLFPDSSAGAEARRYMELWQEQLQQKQIGNHTFQCLSDSHQALSLLLHMKRHMTTGCIGLRQLCDWAAFLTSVEPEFFADQIVPELKRCGLKEFAGVLTWTAIGYLRLKPVYGMPFPSVRKQDIPDMIGEILRAGSIHNKNNTKDGSNFFVEESGTLLAVQVFAARLNSLAQRKYPVTKKLPFLLPLFWLYLPLRYWIRSLLGKRRQKSLLRTITITKQRKQLYKTLKLFQSVPEK